MSEKFEAKVLEADYEEISHFLLPNYVCAQEFIGANHGAFLSPIESNKRQLFCGEKNAGAIGEILFKIFKEWDFRFVKDNNIFVQNRLFHYPELIWAF